MFRKLNTFLFSQKLPYYSNALQKSIQNEKKNLAYLQFLPIEWSEIDIQNYFKKYESQIKSIRIVRDITSKSTGRALLELDSEDNCNKFIQENHENFIDTINILQKIVVKPFQLKKNTNKIDIQRNKKQVYITGLPKKINNEELLELIADFGEIENVQIPRNNDGINSKGYAFVLFKLAKDAEQFMTFMHGKQFMGNRIAVQVYKFRFDTQKPSFSAKKVSEEDTHFEQNKVNYDKLQQLFDD